VPIDPRTLKPTQLVQLLNSTPLGEVANERTLYRHRARAGLRIGDGKTVDLLRYVAWLVLERHRPKPEPEGLTGYDAHKERAAQRNRELSLLGRDIGELPAVVNAERKARAERDFRYFCERYFPQTFHLHWSDDHLRVIAKIERAVVEGGLFAMAMPRGSGKTSLCETACLWALTYGHREFVALIGSDEDHAENMLDSIKVELETNDSLLEDFPEVVFPIRALEGIHQRAGGQLFQGRQTHIGWTAKEIVLPTIPDSKASGGVIRVAGITGRIRGMKYKRPDGQSVRPSLVLIDDPQTDESARSPSQCANRERILAGAILGLAGPGRKIAGLMTVTVVRPDDIADRVLDRDKHPQWQGERTKMVYAFPTNEALWAKYSELWREGMRADRGIGEATDFYRRHREEMDEGAVVAWSERHNPDELSAIQHAMNLRLDRGDEAFFAEFQNEPLPDDQGADELLSVDTMANNVNGYKRGEVPIGCTHLTMFIDVQAKALFWLVAGWQDDFTGYVIDYGTEPDQQTPHFTLREIKRTLQRASPQAGLEGAIYAGLERLTRATLGREWRRADGALVHIDRCLIDAKWGQTTDVVYQFCRASEHASVLLPSMGYGITASSRPMVEWPRKPGERHGLNWLIRRAAATRRAVQHVLYDTNWWKSFVHARLAVALGDPGCLSLFGRKGTQHQLLAEHLRSEYRVRTAGRGRTVDEWKLPPGRDNHWLDGLVGCAMAGSMLGAVLFGTDVKRRPRKRVRYSEIQRAKQAARMRR
jgi:hypothetical protein